jgi:hypothetical protein
LEILEDRRLLSGTSSVLPELAPPATQHVSSPSDDSEAAASHKAERDDSAQHSESDWSPAQSIQTEDASTSSEDHNSTECTHDSNDRESESKPPFPQARQKSESDTEESDKTTQASSTDVNDDTKESKSTSAVQTEHESEDSPSAGSTATVASQNTSSGSLTAAGSSAGSEREDDSSRSGATPVASNSGGANLGGTEAGDGSGSDNGQANQIASNSEDNRQRVSPPSTSQQDDSVENHAVASAPGGNDTGSAGSSNHTGTSAEVQPAVNSAGKSADPVAHQNGPAANGIVTVDTVQSPVQAAEPSAAREAESSAAISAPRNQDGTITPASDSGDSQLARAARLDLPAAQGANVVNNGSSGESAEEVLRGDSLTLANATADDSVPGPVGADLLAGSPPLPLESVQAGIQSFLRELDHLGSAMIAAPAGVSLAWWLVSALAAASAFEIARRQMQRGQADLAGNLAQEPMFSWFPEGK